MFGSKSRMPIRRFPMGSSASNCPVAVSARVFVMYFRYCRGALSISSMLSTAHDRAVKLAGSAPAVNWKRRLPRATGGRASWSQNALRPNAIGNTTSPTAPVVTTARVNRGYRFTAQALNIITSCSDPLTMFCPRSCTLTLVIAFTTSLMNVYSPAAVSAARVKRTRNSRSVSGFTGKSIGPLTADATTAATGCTMLLMKCLLGMVAPPQALLRAHLEGVERLADGRHAPIVLLTAARPAFGKIEAPDRRVVRGRALQVLRLRDRHALAVAVGALGEGVVLPRAVARRVDALAEAARGRRGRDARFPRGLGGAGRGFPALLRLLDAVLVDARRRPGAVLPLVRAVLDALDDRLHRWPPPG